MESQADLKVSIITISHNCQRYISAALDSVVSQDYDDVEYIVVDGGSTDATRDIITKRAAEFAWWVSEPDAGPASALNKGFHHATGDICGVVNCDDMLLPGAVRTAADAFRQFSTADVVYGNGILITDGRLELLFSDPWDLELYAIGAVSIVQQATFFRREAFERAGGFNPANRTCWDGELLVDMALAGCRFQAIDEFLGAFRLHQNSITGSQTLATEYQSESQRITAKILGRSRTKRDYLRGVTARLRKWLRNSTRAQTARGTIESLSQWYSSLSFRP